MKKSLCKLRTFLIKSKAYNAIWYVYISYMIILLINKSKRGIFNIGSGIGS